MKQIIISPFWQSYGQGQIKLLKESIIEFIPEGTAREAWLLSLEPTDKILAAFSDADPNDKAQIEKIVLKHTSENIIPFAAKEIDQIILKIKDTKIRNFVQVLAKLPFGAAQLVTDDNPNNAGQIRTFVEKWAEDPANQAVVMDQLLKPAINGLFKKNPLIAGLLINVIEQATKDLNIDIDGDGV